MGDALEESDALLAEGTRVGDFVIRGFLGEGAMGQVYVAQDVMLGRRVALKFIKRSVMERHGVERFLEEARATASFNHPHIVTLYAVGEHDGRPYLALEHIDGDSLRARLRSTPQPMPMREVLRCCRAVAEAVAEAHRRGLIHADLKPENIVISRDARVRVVDFGLAELAGDAPHALSGTPAYMAPERWRGAPPTGAIDVWALGVTLHELVTGDRPIPDAELSRLTLATGALELPDLPAEPWAQLVRDCLALDPEARPTAEELVSRLTAMIDPPAILADGVGARVIHRARTKPAHVANLPTIATGDGPWPLHPATGTLLEAVTSACDAVEYRQEAARWLASHIGAEFVLVASLRDFTPPSVGLVGSSRAWLGRVVDGFGRYSPCFAQFAATSRRWGGFARERDTDIEDWAGRYDHTGFHEELVFPLGLASGSVAGLVVRQAQLGLVMIGRERSSRRITEDECDLLNGILPILGMAEAIHASASVAPASHELTTATMSSSEIIHQGTLAVRGRARAGLPRT